MSGKTPTPLYGARSYTNERGNPATSHHVGIDEQVGTDNSLRVQALNLGMQTEDARYSDEYGFLGAALNATGVGVTCEPGEEGGGGFWGGLKGFDAGVEVVAHQEGLNLGYRADVVAAEFGARTSNRNSKRDRGAKAGLSFGAPSGAVRFRNEDLDGDGRSEVGAGVSLPLGPAGVSVDRVSETPFGDAALAAADAMTRSLAIPVSPSFLDGAADALLGEEYTPSLVIDDFVRSEVL